MKLFAKKFSYILFGFMMVLGLMFGLYKRGIYIVGSPITLAELFEKVFATTAAVVTSPFTYHFSTDGSVEETGVTDDSSSPYWWVNSGAYMKILSGVGGTSMGDLPATNKWRLAYSMANPVDTDNGYHPQNIFRLISRSNWQNFRQSAYFTIVRDNLSTSPNRSVSNGLLLFNRYLDSQNLYYAGVRVDGTAVIKKKFNSIYYTMAQNKIFPGTYDAQLSPSLLPKNTSIGLRTEVVNDDTTGLVNIKLYMDLGKTGVWKLIASAIDDGKSYGGSVISRAGFGGIRTDFMDVLFDDWSMETIPPLAPSPCV